MHCIGTYDILALTPRFMLLSSCKQIVSLVPYGLCNVVGPNYQRVSNTSMAKSLSFFVDKVLFIQIIVNCDSYSSTHSLISHYVHSLAPVLFIPDIRNCVIYFYVTMLYFFHKVLSGNVKPSETQRNKEMLYTWMSFVSCFIYNVHIVVK